MRFALPQLLWLLLLVPALAVFLVWAWRTKQRLIAQFVQSRSLAQLTVGVSKTRQKVRLALLVAAVALGVLALARPQWGFSWEEVSQKGLDIVVAIDTSRSMLAADIPPNRLERANAGKESEQGVVLAFAVSVRGLPVEFMMGVVTWVMRSRRTPRLLGSAAGIRAL